jgi:hypothetical protein
VTAFRLEIPYQEESWDCLGNKVHYQRALSAAFSLGCQCHPDLYFRSVDQVVEQYHRPVLQVNGGGIGFASRNLDTGMPTRAGQYRLADEAYGKLLHRLAKRHFPGAARSYK